MKSFKHLIIFCLLFLSPTLLLYPESVPLKTTASVFFSPKGGCTTAIVNTINSARQEILVQAYSFTSQPIADALVNAYKRNIKVEIILDKSQLTAKSSMLNYVVQSGIPTYIDSKHAIAHNKIIIIDKKTVITGSFNFTKSAEERNAENLIIIPSAELAGVYIKNFLAHKQHSVKYKISH